VRFVSERLDTKPAPQECKDLTDFAHGKPATILECAQCALLIRAEQQSDAVQQYADDPYDPKVMEHLFPRYVEAFRQKQQPYRSLLPCSAEVLEIGPHMGGFLEVAKEWGWHPVGIDVGRDTTSFVNLKGFVTYQGTLEECGFPDARFDGVFVWNCFDQIPEPHALLSEIRRVMKAGGLVVLRTPNGLFYRIAERFLASSPRSELCPWIQRALGYNNLLAFPYLYGWSSANLIDIGAAHGFRCEGKLNAEVITLPFPKLHDWVLEDARATNAALLEWSKRAPFEANGHLTGPWIELFFRAV